MKLRTLRVLAVTLALAAGFPRASLAFDRAAMLILVDRSQSMASAGKWATASLAVVQALDDDAFDAVDIGLYASPSGTVTGPACLFNLPVDCATPFVPQIGMALAGSQKSADATGVRRQIMDWFDNNSPANGGIADQLPLRQAVQSAIATLTGLTVDGPRVLVIVTDGSPCCGQLGGLPGFPNCNGCDHEWEHPDNLVSILAAANGSPTEKVDTFVIGIPGADTYDPTGCGFPPYRMKLALSAMAHAGAPDFEPDGCDGTTFTQGGADPTLPCHIDLTAGFTVNALETALEEVQATAIPEPGFGASMVAGIGALVWIERRRRVARRSAPCDRR